MAPRVERSFRGISERLAIRYLTNLGGERVADREAGATGNAAEAGGSESPDSSGSEAIDVRGDGWTARVSAEQVRVGPSLTLTEVTVALEGDEGVLEDLVSDFARKAMRAGG